MNSYLFIFHFSIYLSTIYLSIYLSLSISISAGSYRISVVEECDGPYAWRKPLVPSKVYGPWCKGPIASHPYEKVEKVVAKTFPQTSLYPNGPQWSACLPPDLLKRPSLQLMIQEAIKIGSIAFRLPKSNAVAGGILRHSICTIDHLFDNFSPMIWKVGFTHNCVWRWTNTKYGYSHSQDRWSNMVVVYVTREPQSPAMLEAALIERYQGCFEFALSFRHHFGFPRDMMISLVILQN